MYDLKEINISEKDVICLSFDINLYDMERASFVRDQWHEVFPKNDIIISLDNQNSVLIIHKDCSKITSLPF